MSAWKTIRYLSLEGRPKCPSSLCVALVKRGYSTRSVRYGYYPRRWEKHRIQRFLCRNCNHTFSLATGTPTFRQHKPFVNNGLFEWFASCGSQRRGARIFRINFKTVVRKFELIGSECALFNEEDRQKAEATHDIQFDEMESIEHSKLKPLSIPLVVDAKTRKILGFEVCKMPAKGHLVEKSLKKYGPREDEREEALDRLFRRLLKNISPSAIILSDSKPQYAKHVKLHFPNAHYYQVLSRRGRSSGLGELKQIANDPIFSLNHTAAMIRANVNRMFRKTWCTTKKPDRLAKHLEIYTKYHNTVLIQQKSEPSNLTFEIPPSAA